MRKGTATYFWPTVRGDSECNRPEIGDCPPGHGAVEPLRRLLPAHEAEVLEQTDRATLRVRLPTERVDDFRRQVIDMSNGTARIG